MRRVGRWPGSGLDRENGSGAGGPTRSKIHRDAAAVAETEARFWAMPVLSPVAATTIRSSRPIRLGDHLPRRSEPDGRRPPERSSGASRVTGQRYASTEAPSTPKHKI